MSQPSDRSAKIPVPGQIDSDLKEFWVENPWDIVSKGHNLSAYERNRTFLNVGGKDFLDVSYISGTDSDGDGRSVVAADFRGDGRLDLLVRQVGGGALLLYENGLPARHYLKVSLRGTKSNRLGIGARLTAEAGGRRVVRELYPANSYQSQMPSLVHLGLGDANKVDRLTIRWPSGTTQVVSDIVADRHVVIEEGKSGPGDIETVVPGQVIRP